MGIGKRRIKPQRANHSFTAWYKKNVRANEPPESELNKYQDRYKKSMPSDDVEPIKARQAWNEIAVYYNKFDRLNVRKYFIDYILSQARLNGKETIVSIGSSTGIFENFLGFKVPRGTVIGVDFAHNMNIEAKRLKERARSKNAHFVTGEAKRLPIKSGSANIVIMSAPSIQEFYGSLHEASRVLIKDPNSKLIIQSIETKVSLQELKRGLQKAGFEISNLKTLRVSDTEMAVNLVAKLNK
ncbi:MAG: methyltransferase domain-containing protein [Candidatus Diapherotrites archaeon]|nr:methyltransferase domain-containing protein [Candidatus Diapherotrites archaeon]